MRTMLIGLLVGAFVHVSGSLQALAAPGDAISSATQRSLRAERSYRSCSALSGDAILRCVATATSRYAGSLSSCSYIAGVAPQAAPTAREAAQSIANVKTKQAALSVLNQTSSVLRALAAQSSGETRAVYGRINRAFQTAISVINSKT